jgi:hypothetical protein
MWFHAHALGFIESLVPSFPVLDWFSDHKSLLAWATGASVALVALGLILAPIVIVRLPADYFAHPRRPHREKGGSSARGAMLVKIGKNALGVVLMVAGAAMLVLPGPGIVVLLLGVLMVDFPGKYRAQRWLLARRGVMRIINWLRRKWGKEPMKAGTTA